MRVREYEVLYGKSNGENRELPSSCIEMKVNTRFLKSFIRSRFRVTSEFKIDQERSGEIGAAFKLAHPIFK